ncbi:MAG TPA: TetR/AcrR family transcriptional regulator [Steroidobacteraceae bacterium]|nr:TetR/AcrR family transcriptional regulator [Steroidobacteraceae bacterium]
MATRATQYRILQAALELFNEHGTAAISAGRIAERCGISKGNLQYHFRNKREIICAVFQQAIGEMDAGWYRDHLAPTLEHMAAMFVRQLQLILKYRFFYREMADLLRQDPLLRKRFAQNRERRIKEIERFMLALQAGGLMRFPPDPARLRAIIDVTWIVNENWLNYMDYHDREVSVEAMLEGYAEILEVLRPYLCADIQQITRESYITIERLAAQATGEAEAVAV